MSEESSFLGGLIRETVQAPRSAARRLLAMGLPGEARLIGLGAVAVLSVLLVRLSVFGIEDRLPPLVRMLGDPFFGIPAHALQMLGVAAIIRATAMIYRRPARFSDALLIAVWVEFIVLLFQAAQIVLTLVLPPVGLLMAVVTVGMFVWVLVNMTAVLLGMDSLLKTGLGLLASFVGLVILLSIVLALLGFYPTATVI